MAKSGTTNVVPRLSADEGRKFKLLPLLRLTSTYVQRGRDSLPKVGDAAQWRPRKSYFRDLWEARFVDIKTGMQWIRA